VVILCPFLVQETARPISYCGSAHGQLTLNYDILVPVFKWKCSLTLLYLKRDR